jgi:molybdopterin/thiamine biosynthesis adenylyltransferase
MQSKAKLDRYSRNILIEKIGAEGQRKLLSSKILVAGAGGLGSSVIANLACMGIGTIGIIDFDVIEPSNFNRQFIHSPDNTGKNKTQSAKEWINHYNPDINVEIYNLKIENDNYSEIFSKYDIVTDCFDSYSSKFALNKICVSLNKILIHGGVQEFSGQVFTVIPKETACLSCFFPEYETQSQPKGIISPIVNIIGSMQSSEALKILLKIDPLLTNCILSYDCVSNDFRKIKVTKNISCAVCADKNT